MCFFREKKKIYIYRYAYIYVRETDHMGLKRIQEYQHCSKNGDINSKHVCHSVETDHTPGFDDIDISSSIITNYLKCVFVKGWLSKSQF